MTVKAAGPEEVANLLFEQVSAHRWVSVSATSQADGLPALTHLSAAFIRAHGHG